MRILIGNHIDPAIRDRGDLRAWTQRILWFACDGDVVVLSDEPNRQFLAYATSFTGVNTESLRILVPVAGRHGGRLLDPESLTSAEFLRRVRDVIGEGGLDQVDEVFALWPSAHVSHFAAALGVEDRLPGAGFFSQGGGELGNNKATFRALAASVGVPIPVGVVCRSMHEAVAATADLLAATEAVVVKQAHNGAGVGNQLVLRDTSLVSDHVGARHLHRLDGSDSMRSRRTGRSVGTGRLREVVSQSSSRNSRRTRYRCTPSTMPPTPGHGQPRWGRCTTSGGA